MLTVWLLSALLLQESKPVTAEQTLQKAILVEEGERDSARAEALYREVVATQAWPEAVRAQARVRLARLLQRAGKVEEAKAELTAVAQGTGLAAETAKALLEQKPGAEDEQLRARVDGLLRKIQTSSGDERNRWIGELHWLGQKAVAHIATAALLASSDLEYVSVLSKLIHGIGGPEAMAFFRKVAELDDADFRRAVLRTQGGTSFNEPARLFWRDQDASVRQMAFERSVLSPAELDQLSQDSDAAVRRLAMHRIQYSLTAGISTSDLELAVRVLARGLEDKVPDVRSMAMLAADPLKSHLNTLPQTTAVGPGPTPGHNQSLAHRSLSARQLLLRIAGMRDLLTWGSGYSRMDPFVPPLTADEITRMAQGLGPVPAPLRQEAGASCFWLVRHLLLHSMPGWDRRALPQVLSLASLGYDNLDCGFAEWIIAHASKEDATQVAAHLGEIANNNRIIQWLKDQDFGTQPGLVAPLSAWVRKTLEQPSWNSSYVYGVLQLLVMTGGAEDFLVELARTRRDTFGLIANAFLQNTRAKVSAELIARLMAVPTDGGKDGKRDNLWQQTNGPRNQLFLRLLALGQIQDAAVFGRAYALGLDHTNPSEPDQKTLGAGTSTRGLGGLGLTGREGSLLNRFTPAQLVPLFEACLAGSEEAPCKDVTVLLQGGPTGRRLKLPPPVLDLLGRRCLDNAHTRQWLMFLLDRGAGEFPGREDLFGRALADADRSIQFMALQNMQGPISAQLAPKLKPALDSGSEQVVTSAIRLLARSGAPEVRQWIEQLTTHAEANVRITAAWELSQLDTPPNLEPLAVLLRDRESAARSAACSYLERTLDRKALPLLLGAMRDSSESVRERAEAAVRKVRFFLEQSEGTGNPSPRTDTAAAAQALLAQAKKATDKRVRIAALVSLGVLGVPEVLPGVIEFLTDPDAEVAAAADAAVKQLQARK